MGCGSSGVTKVGVTRGGNWGCHPYFFPKNWRPFFGHHHLPVLRCQPYLLSPQKTNDLFCSSPSLYWYFPRVSTPEGWRCHPAPFLPVRLRLSTILYKFAHIIFFLRVSPPGGCHPGRFAPPPLVTPLCVRSFTALYEADHVAAESTAQRFNLQWYGNEDEKWPKP